MKFKFGQHITVSYGLAQHKAYFICFNRLDKKLSWAYFPEWRDVESITNDSIKKGWKRSWKR